MLQLSLDLLRADFHGSQAAVEVLHIGPNLADGIFNRSEPGLDAIAASAVPG